MIAACVFAIIIFVASLAAAIYLSWQLAIADALDELTLLDRRVIARAAEFLAFYLRRKAKPVPSDREAWAAQ